LKDTASSPEKKDDSSASVTDGEAHEIEARRKLDMNLNEHGTENGMDTSGEVGDIPPLPPSYVKTKDRSKVRKTGTERNSNEILASSAASLEDDRQA
jgi:hypothetical protein